MVEARTLREPSANPPQSSETDEELLLLYRDQGNTAAFEELVHRYTGELYSYLRRYLGDATMAEDVFQATFLRLHRKSHLFKEGHRVRPWLYRIATHLAIDALRTAGRHRPVSLDTARRLDDSRDGTLLDLMEAATPPPPVELEEEERREQVRQAVSRLPDNLRLPLILTFFQGLKYGEAAEVLGVPTGTVKWQVHAALKRLQTELRRESFGLKGAAEMEPELIGYLLDALDEDEREQVAQAIHASAELARCLELLRQRLTFLEVERGLLDPPSHLALETCRRFRELVDQPRERTEPE